MSIRGTQHSEYYLNVRNPELSELADKITALCREYDVLDIEFKGLIELVDLDLFASDFIDNEDFEDNNGLY